MGQRVLLLSHGELFSFGIGTCLGEAGYDVDVLAAHKWSDFRLSRHCRSFSSFEPELLYGDSPELVNRLNQLCRKRQAAVVVPADFESVQYVIRHRGEIECPHLFPVPELDVMQRLHNKWTFNQLLEELDIPHARTRLIQSEEDIPGLDLGYPVVVKPPEGHSSIGIWIVDSEEDLRALMGDPRAEVQYPAVVQEYIDGEDMDFTVLAAEGEVLAWTHQRRRTSLKHYVYIRDDGVIEACSRIIAATNYSGVIDFDLRTNDKTGETCVSEANPRFPGTTLHKMWAGLNLPELGVMAALGEDPRPHFEPIAGELLVHTVSPKRLLKSLVSGRLTPHGLTPAQTGSWRQSLSDAKPYLFGSLRYSLGRRLCRWLAPRRPGRVGLAPRYKQGTAC